MDTEEIRLNAEKRFDELSAMGRNLQRQNPSYSDVRLLEIQQESILHTLLLCELVTETRGVR